MAHDGFPYPDENSSGNFAYKPKMTADLDIPHDPAERERRRLEGWDRWYASLPDDLTRKLSLHDFKRLGDCFKAAFGIST